MVKAVAVASALLLAGATDAARASSLILADGANVLPPPSFTKFCLDYPRDCGGGPARVRMSGARMRQLEAVNRSVNGKIAPTADRSRFRFWALDVARGDCNSYAVQKRHDLIQSGWPAGALALTVVETAAGEGHLVVTARTDGGDYILDNLRSGVVDWRRAGYRWIMRQSADHPQYWVALDSARVVFAPAARDELRVAKAGG